MLNIVLFGPPGAGKGTQASKLVEKYGFNHISTGEVIRAEIASNSPLGRKMLEYTASGALAPDELVIDIVDDYVGKHLDVVGNIFDGFPRTVVQAEALDRLMGGHGIAINIMIALEVPDKEVIERLVNRGKYSGREDDTKEVITKRLEIYKQTSTTAANYYDTQGKFFSVNGIGSVDEVFERLCNAIDSLH